MNSSAISPSDRMKHAIGTGVLYLVLVAIAVSIIYPLIWTFFGSVRDEKLFALNPWGLPEQLDLHVYVDVLFTYGIARNLINSLLLSSVGVMISTVLALLASYGLARMRWKGSNLMMAFFLSGIMIPVHSTLIPLYIGLQPFRRIDERFALLIPYIVFSLPTAIFLLTNYMRSISRSLEEAAVIDGCSLFKSFLYVIVPVTGPAIATVTIFSFMGMWNELLFALVFLQKNETHTLPVGILRFTGLYTTQWQLTLAAIVIALIPSLLLYLILQDRIIKGMTAGALKG